MSATSLKLHNNADVKVYAKLKWADIFVGDARIEPGKKASIDCEYVWYDLTVYNNDSGAKLCSKSGVYGYSTYEVVKEGGSYKLNRC